MVVMMEKKMVAWKVGRKVGRTAVMWEQSSAGKRVAWTVVMMAESLVEMTAGTLVACLVEMKVASLEYWKAEKMVVVMAGQ